jgi:hypothetical protein
MPMQLQAFKQIELPKGWNIARRHSFVQHLV